MEKDVSKFSQESGGFPLARTEIVREIYLGELSPEEKRQIEEKTLFYETADVQVYNDIQGLRNEVGTIEGWKTAKEKARAELADVPSDVLETIMEKFSPFIKNLPAGHSKGHFLRDTVNLSMVFQDPSISDYDAVEVFVGILGAMYHDIGNSIADRYTEQRRFSGHAEIGAHLFGEISQGLIGENLRKMAELAIAGHTHYTRDRVVDKNGDIRTTAPYDDEIVDGNRMAFWWTRQSDRMDAQGAIMDVRHLITKADPTEDFDGQNFHQVWDNPENDFRHQFNPVLRTSQERTSKEKPESVQNILEHVKMFADSNFNPNLPYAKHDNPFYTKLIHDAAQDQDEFVGTVLDGATTLSPQEIQGAFEQYFKLCDLIEPAKNTQEQIDKMRQKFGLLSPNEQNHWANGFRVLTQRIYPRLYARVKAISDYSSPATIKDEDPAAQAKVKDIIDNHMYPLAAEVWKQFDPAKIAV